MRLNRYTVGLAALLAAASLAFIGASVASSSSSPQLASGTRHRSNAGGQSPDHAKDLERPRALLGLGAQGPPPERASRAPSLAGWPPYNNGPQQLLILKSASSARYGVWYQVRLPFRPNRAAALVARGRAQGALNTVAGQG